MARNLRQPTGRSPRFAPRSTPAEKAAAREAADAQEELFPKVMDQHPEFAAYLRKNPQAYVAFARETYAAISHGEQLPLGSKDIAERCRRKVHRGEDGYAINNTHVSNLARLFEEKYGREVFTKRRQRA